jgi:hypothetical protein
MTPAAGYGLLALVLLVASSSSLSIDQTAHAKGTQKSEDFVFEVQPRVIAAGETAVLRWSIKGATKVVIEEMPEWGRDLRVLGTFGATGTLRVSPRESTTYVISCTGPTTYSCASVTVRVRVKQR